MFYEPLFQANLAQPAKKNGTPNIYPFLATGFKWGKGGKSITFTIRKGVKWSDGTPFTPADVAFTYKMIQKNADVNNNGLADQGRNHQRRHRHREVRHIGVRGLPGDCGHCLHRAAAHLAVGRRPGQVP